MLKTKEFAHQLWSLVQIWGIWLRVQVLSYTFGFSFTYFSGSYYSYSSYYSSLSSSSSELDFSSPSFSFYSPSTSSSPSPSSSSSSESTDSYCYSYFSSCTIFSTTLLNECTLFVIGSDEITELFDWWIVRLQLQNCINWWLLFLPNANAYTYFLSRTKSKKS